MAFGDVVQSNTGSGTTATTTPTLPGAVTAGNLVVLTFAADDYNATPNAGWTQSTGMEQQTFHGGYLWWFIATSDGQAIPGYTVASAVRSHWNLAEYAGPFNSTPYDVSNGQFQQTSTNSYTTPAVTPSAGDRLLIANVNFQHATSDLGTPGTWLNSFVQVTSSVSNGANPRLAVGQARLVATANGSTAYSCGATLSTAQVAQSKSGLIIAFKAGAGGTNGTVSAVAATASASAPAPVVSAAGAAVVAAVVALATALAPVPVVAGTTVVSGGGPGAATAQAFAPVVSGGANVTAVTATATAAGLAPAVGASGTANVAAVAATASASALPPAATGVRNPTVTVVRAQAAATAPSPIVTGSGSTVVVAVSATATATAQAPTVTGTRSPTVAAPSATATATGAAPTIDATRAATVNSTAAVAVAAGIAPGVVGGSANDATAAPTPGLTLTVPAGDLTLTTPAATLALTVPDTRLEVTS